MSSRKVMGIKGFVLARRTSARGQERLFGAVCGPLNLTVSWNE